MMMMRSYFPTTRSFIKYLITISILFTFILNIKFRQVNRTLDEFTSAVADSFLLYNNQTTTTTAKLEFLKEFISSHNSVRPSSASDNRTTHLVILIQVHKRVKYLQKLIESLNVIRTQLENVIVIYSHDFYDLEINEMIKNESNFFYKQIFYPYMLQLYENQFPGSDPNDCPRSIKKHLALRMRCNNAEYPDSYGNYRECNIVQIKHHWWWKLAFVFDSFAYTKNNKNLGVLLLEEDYYLMPDTLYILDKLKKSIRTDRDIVSLAYFDKKKQDTDYSANGDKFGRALWNSAYHNTGLYIPRSLWNQIKDCSNEFCTYDDYNWDWTLQFVGQSCLRSTFFSIFPLASRVIHIGECGTHHKGSNCDPNEKVQHLNEIIKKDGKKFFPKEPKFTFESKLFFKLRKSNGGWSDIRDHMLCKSFVLNFKR